MSQDFDAALQSFVDYCAQVNHAHTTKHYLNVPLALFELESGPRYVRIVHSSNGSGRSVAGFVRREDGAILYPAGWKGPYLKGKHAVRGNIYDRATWTCVGPYGVKTLR